MVPGSLNPVTDAEAKELAADIGFPILLKAAKGGGGKGMRAVHDAKEMDTALRLVRGEAASSFGSDDLLVEKLVLNPRHVEAQIIADKHGQTFFVGERECSVQRRHQKVIEEAPSPTPGRRAARGVRRRRGQGGRVRRLRQCRHGGVPAGAGRATITSWR